MARGVVRQTVLPVLMAIQVVLLSSTSSLAATQSTILPTDTVQYPAVLSPKQFLSETNAARLAAGLAPLKLNETLSKAAQDKAADMVARHYWDHFRPGDGKAPWDFIRESGYSYKAAGENLARGFRTAHGITEAWLASPSHRANLLSPKYEEVGFAIAYTTGENGEPVLLTVQLFGDR